jgi:hypothetical protein
MIYLYTPLSRPLQSSHLLFWSYNALQYARNRLAFLVSTVLASIVLLLSSFTIVRLKDSYISSLVNLTIQPSATLIYNKVVSFIFAILCQLNPDEL